MECHFPLRLDGELCYVKVNKTCHASEGALVPHCAPRRVPPLLVVPPIEW